jgi:broad specificity phosphatase PhoE
MSRLVLVRHGEAEGTAGRFCGRYDPPLSELGRRQAEALRLLAGPALYTSPACRAVETAAEIAPGATVVDDLREMDFGEADGLRHDEAAARWPELYAAWLETPTRISFPGGEDFGAFRRRVLAALDRIDLPAVVVTHGGVIRTALAAWLGMPDERLVRIGVGCGSVSVVEWQGETPIVRLVNGPPATSAPAG